MDCNKEEALRAKEIAEKRFMEKDFVGAKKYAMKAQTLHPELEGISQMLATFDVYVASEVQINGETNFYSILGLNLLADEDTVKKQYRKLALMLHPDKNKTVGADGAFKLVSDAWGLLSDSSKRTSYDLRINKSSAKVDQPNFSAVQNLGANGSNNCSKPSSNSQTPPKPRSFWTVCTTCKMQYEYLRKYLNNRLSCKNCRSTFVAVETGRTPMNGSIPFYSWSLSPEYGHASQFTYFPADTILFTGPEVSQFHSGLSTQYPNMSFQWTPFHGTSARVVGAHGSTTTSTGFVQQANKKVKGMGEKTKAAKEKDLTKNAMGYRGSNTFSSYTKPPVSKADRPEKKRKVDEEGISRNGYEEEGPRTANPELKMTNGEANFKSSSSSEAPIRRSMVAPAFDARQLLIDKARTEIRKKLEEMRLAAMAAAAAAEEKAKAQTEVDISNEPLTRIDLGVSLDQSEIDEPASIAITVPDSDFHDFDKERSEGCFKPKQIWALYDEEDGMPRLYCLVRQVLSVKPFKIHVSYLNSESDTEIGSGNWVESGFAKSCGNFKRWNSDVIDSVNIFSHVLSGEKFGRGRCIRIFPRKGDIWAVYRNWSPDWNRTTPDEVRHQYEMVEVVDDYTKELGVCVTPLVKVKGFKTVYQRKMDQNAIRWIPRGEMLQFSHQVPSWLLKGEVRNLPKLCWDLDPAATPEELLQGVPEARADNKPLAAEK